MEYVKKRVLVILGLLVFFGCVAAVVLGQKQIGYPGAAIMLAGLAGMVLCLYLYNRSNK